MDIAPGSDWPEIPVDTARSTLRDSNDRRVAAEECSYWARPFLGRLPGRGNGLWTKCTVHFIGRTIRGTGAVPLGSFVDLALGLVVRKNGIWPALVLVLHDVVGGLDA